MVRAIAVTVPGGPEALTELDLAPEPIASGQVRVRVHCAAVSPTDTLIRSGLRFGLDETSVKVPGMDVAGTIVELGPGVGTSLSVGERVMAIVEPHGEHGGYRAELVLPARSVTPIPAGMSDAEASTLPMNGLTAQLALDVLDLPAGAWLAVTGAAGTLGGYVVQLATRAGLKVIADSQPSDEPFVRSCGADQIVQRGADFAAQVRRLNPAGVDGLVDCALLDAAALPAVGNGGRVATVRRFTGHGERELTVIPVFVSDYVERADKLEQLARLAAGGELTLRVAGEFPAANAGEAHRRLEAGGSRGRFVLRF